MVLMSLVQLGRAHSYIGLLENMEPSQLNFFRIIIIKLIVSDY